MAGWITSLLKAGASIAAWLGAEKLVEWFENTSAQSSGLSTDQIVAKLESKLNQIKAKDTKLYSALADEISKYPEGKAILSPTAARNVRTNESVKKKQLIDVESVMTEGDTLQNRIHNYAYQPSSYKLSTAGRNDLSNIETAIDQYAGKRRISK